MAVGQLLLLDGVHLPRLVGCPAAAGVLGRGPSRRRGGGPGAVEPSLDGAGAGGRTAGQQVGQLQADAAGAPSGPFGPQTANGGMPGLDDPLGLAAGGVAGLQGGWAELLTPGEEAAWGRAGQVEGAGDGGGRPALVGQAEDRVTQLDGQGARHVSLPTGKAGNTADVTRAGRGANLVSPFR